VEVPGKVGCVAVVLKGLFVFFIVCVEAPSSLAHICFVAFLACEFVYARTCVFVWGRFLHRETQARPDHPELITAHTNKSQEEVARKTVTVTHT
jgi:hypothetical protein